MNYPSDELNSRRDKPIFMNVLTERLDSLSASELADGLEMALDYMTEETYDPEVIDAYLAALDARVPLPEHTDVDTAFDRLCQRVDEMAEIKRMNPRTERKRRIYRHGIRAGIAAAAMVFCLFGGMIFAQASGMDVFGAIARWTESVFTFSDPDSLPGKDNPSVDENVPDEYKELQVLLQERGLPIYVPKIPEEFVADESILYIRPDDGGIHFGVIYLNESDYIEYSIIENVYDINENHEKDTNHVGAFKHNEISYYIFRNNDASAIAWSIGDFEYILTTNLSSDFLKEIIQSDN